MSEIQHNMVDSTRLVMFDFREIASMKLKIEPQNQRAPCRGNYFWKNDIIFHTGHCEYTRYAMWLHYIIYDSYASESILFEMFFPYVW